MIHLPEIPPYIFKIGGIGPTWYGLMYVIGFMLGYKILSHWAKSDPSWDKEQVNSLLTYLILGVTLGGRIGFVIFYQFDWFIRHPLYLFKITDGGMSFHGGLLGVIFAVWLFCKFNKKAFLASIDFIVPVIPIGLFFGRIGNFINGELWGYASNMPWAMVFPQDPDQIPRHPSQLYEAFLEGLLLFIILYFFSRKERAEGKVSGLFLLGYGFSRFIVEFIRLPDAYIGYIAFGWMTRGQLLTLPMIAIGFYLLLRRVSK